MQANTLEVFHRRRASLKELPVLGRPPSDKQMLKTKIVAGVSAKQQRALRKSLFEQTGAPKIAPGDYGRPKSEWKFGPVIIGP